MPVVKNLIRKYKIAQYKLKVLKKSFTKGTFGAKVSKIEKDRFTMNYIVVSTKHQKTAAEGEGLIVAFDYRENKKSMIPQKLRDRILNIKESAGSSHIK